jgi:trehalose/maltose transport system substrate-binding protein
VIIARPKLAGLLTAAAVVAASLIECGSEPPCGRWGTGDITFAIGEDQSEGRQVERLVEEWGRESGKQVELVYLPATADGQRSQLAATAQARSPEYDVLGLDVIWTAELASRGYVEQLDPRFDEAALERDFLPRPLDTARWDDKLWAIP